MRQRGTLRNAPFNVCTHSILSNLSLDIFFTAKETAQGQKENRKKGPRKGMLCVPWVVDEVELRCVWIYFLHYQSWTLDVCQLGLEGGLSSGLVGASLRRLIGKKKRTLWFRSNWRLRFSLLQFQGWQRDADQGVREIITVLVMLLVRWQQTHYSPDLLFIHFIFQEDLRWLDRQEWRTSKHVYEGEDKLQAWMSLSCHRPEVVEWSGNTGRWSAME